MSGAGAAATQDALLGGRVRFAQPEGGYRVAIDPVLLAAAVPDAVSGRAADLGCGAGAASLCLAVRRPDLGIVGIERDAGAAGLARRNVAENGLDGRIDILEADLGDAPRMCGAGAFDAVITNPPFLDPARASPVTGAKAAATIEGRGGLGEWVGIALQLVRAKGHVLFIQRADRLDDLLHALRGGAGDVTVFPLWPKPGAAAKRIIVAARKGVRTPPTLAPGLVLHERDGRYTPQAEAILRGGAALRVCAGKGPATPLR